MGRFKLNPKFNVSGPLGSFVNHVRWLMLLDPLFNFNLPAFDELKYHAIKGPDWPSYKNYFNKNLQETSDVIKKEFIKIGAYTLEFDSIENKLIAFRDKIYPIERTYNNWLDFEWQFRSNLDKFVGVLHMMTDNISQSKNLLLTINPELAYECYSKFNPVFYKNTSFDKFKQKVRNEIATYNQLVEDDPQHYQILATDVLYQPVLDKTFYNKLIKYFGLTDNYDSANYVHRLWFDGHLRAKKDFKVI